MKFKFANLKFFLISLVAVLFLPSSALASTLSLDPSSGTFNQGCNFSLNVNLDTVGAQTDGTDAILIYDTSRFTATSITNGTIYPDFPGSNIDTQGGKVTIAGLASVTTAFTGKGTLATINFTVQSTAPTGATIVKFDFDPGDKGKTTDSNVVQRNPVVDTLNAVTNGNYIIGIGACSTQASPTPAASGPAGRRGGPQATPSSEFIRETLPEGGTPELTFTLAIIGGVLTVLGIFGLALL